jgi:hypothetical protein
MTLRQILQKEVEVSETWLSREKDESALHSYSSGFCTNMEYEQD